MSCLMLFQREFKVETLQYRDDAASLITRRYTTESSWSGSPEFRRIVSINHSHPASQDALSLFENSKYERTIGQP
jgi:hypothetical protein